MSLQLQPDQLLEALRQAESPKFSDFLDQMLHLCDAMAFALVEVTPNIEATTPTNFWDDMVCTPITPIDLGLPIPEHLQGFDDEGWE